jgi:hypothetical protein
LGSSDLSLLKLRRNRPIPGSFESKIVSSAVSGNGKSRLRRYQIFGQNYLAAPDLPSAPLLSVLLALVHAP